MARTRKPRKQLAPEVGLKFYLTPKEDGTLRTYQDVADEFGVSISFVETLGKKHDWVSKRLVYGEIVQDETIKKLAEMNVDVNKELYLTYLINLGLAKMRTVKMAQTEMTPDKLVKTGHQSFKYHTDALKNIFEGLRTLTGQPATISKSDVTNRNLVEELPEDLVKAMDRFLFEPADSKEKEEKPDPATEPKSADQ